MELDHQTIEILKNNLKFDFIAVYQEVISARDLRPIDKLVLSFVKHCDNIFPEVYITDDFIAKSINEPIRTVSRSIQRLKDKKYITSTSYRTEENGEWKSARLLTLNPEIQQLKPSDPTTLNDGTIQIISKMYRKYKKSSKQNLDRFFDALPFSEQNKEFLISKLKG